MGKMVQVENLQKEYTNFKVQDINFEINAGEIVGLIGQNGNGKTTIIKCLLNLVPFQGSIKIFEKDNVEFDKQIKEDIGVIFDELPFEGILNALHVSRIMKGIYKNWSHDTFLQYLKKFGLPEKQKFKEYSKGMCTKLMLAVALSHNAKFLLLDEPTSGIDPVSRKTILDELKSYVKDGDRAALFSTHITGDLEQVADKILCISKGQVSFWGSKTDMMSWDNNEVKTKDAAMMDLLKNTDDDYY